MKTARQPSLPYLLTLLFYSVLIPASYGMAQPLHLYLDADLSHATTSSRSIEQGILTALGEIDNHLPGHSFKLIKLDHRGNSRRSLDNLKKFLKDPYAFAVFGGLHSPPLLANLKFINENGILHFIPWAAAGPITRYGGSENWVFRLSIDDSKAGEVMVKHAVESRHSKHPALLLEKTRWGKSNAETMQAALVKRGISHTGIYWFKWGIRENSSRILIRKIIQSGADSILMVANAPEGKRLTKAMAAFEKEKRLPFFSHWGITGGDFPRVVTAQIRKKIELSFLQTRFSFLKQPVHQLGQQVFNKTASIFGDEIQSPGDITAPAGFIHAYDLTKIMIAAIQQAGVTKDIKTAQLNGRKNLENLKGPVQGLIKTYLHPFSSYDIQHPDAHEALSIDDFTMGQYDEKGRIILIQ